MGSPTPSSPATTRTSRREQTLFIPLDDDVELWDVRIRNTGATPRKLSVFSYVEFSFHHIEIDNQNLQMSLYASGSSYQDGVIEYDFFYEPWTFHYFAVELRARQLRLPARQFPGQLPHGDEPAGGRAGQCSRQLRAGRQPLRRAAQAADDRSPAKKRACVFMLGVGPRAKGQEIKAKYSDPADGGRGVRGAASPTGRRNSRCSSARRRTRASTP